MSGNLPEDFTSFVGRRRELDQVRRLLSSARIVTLTGVGGVGKTRLALRSAAELRAGFPDGVWVLELAALAEPWLLAQAVADVFGLPQSVRGPLPALIDHLKDRRILLVLDNCEHLLEAAAAFVLELLRACPQAHVLATSRHLLGFTGEHVLPVPPLASPPLAQLPAPAELAEWEAPSLFLDRARAVDPEFTLTERNRTTVARLCLRLDGLPLAIELAAARLRVLDVDQLLERLEDRFALLKGGNRAGLPRQQTLGALVDWSYQLCSAQEQLLWSRLSVFAGSFDLTAAAEVCSGDGIEPDEVLDLVAALIDKSVLLTEGSGPGGGRRYRMLESIREFGRARLAESGGESALLLRYRDHYRALAARATAEWFGAEQLTWANRLRAEHANLRGALEVCAVGPAGDVAGLELAANLWPYWVCCGFLSEGRQWLDRMLAAGPARTTARAGALWSSGSLAVLQGDIPTGTALLTECEDMAAELDDQERLAWARQYRGLALMFGGGDLRQASALIEDAVRLHRAAGNLLGLGKSLYMWSPVLSFLGDGQRSAAVAQESREVAEGQGEQWCRSYALYMLSLAAWRAGDLGSAKALALHSVRLRAPFRDSLGLAMAVDILGWIAAAGGKAEFAARLLGSTEPIWQSVGALEFGFQDMVAYYEEAVRRSRAQLGERLFAEAFHAGTRLDQDGAVQLALSDTEPPVPAARTSGNGLSPREQEVAGLVAQGLGNREIAERLVLSQRTVETHVSRIMTKLDLGSRAQVAVWVVRRDG
ncbi:ATP-binding protein [Kitasatospora sp. NPDC056531]|uniref:ATP-binding protein n=1 Tax=Kitasatospora sp. NPDC056531 TaxID=3345856 RepID=UPI0036918780